MSVDEFIDLRKYSKCYDWIRGRIEAVLYRGGLEVNVFHQTVHDALLTAGVVNRGLEVPAVRSYVQSTAAIVIEDLGAVEVKAVNSSFICLQDCCPSDEVQAALVEYYGFYRAAKEHVMRYKSDAPFPRKTFRNIVRNYLRDRTGLADAAHPQNLDRVISQITEELSEEPFIFIAEKVNDCDKEDFEVAYEWALEYLSSRDIDPDRC